MTAGHQEELERAAHEYERRDRVGTGDRYSLTNPLHLQFTQQLESQYVRQLNAASFPWGTAEVLDVGCGTGGNLARLREFGVRRAVGIDLMEARVAQARDRYPNLEFQVGSGTELPFADGTFDLVTQFVCLSSILDPAARGRVITEMFRVTKPGGLVMSFDMGPPSRVLAAARRLRGIKPDSSATPTVGLTLRDLDIGLGSVVSAARPTLHPEIAQVIGDHAVLVAILRSVPVFRSHLVVLFRKEHS